jgi:hypothetical protein
MITAITSVSGRGNGQLNLAELIERATAEKLGPEMVLGRLETAGFGGKDGKLNNTERSIAFFVLAVCQEEAARVAREQADWMRGSVERESERHSKTVVAVAGAVGFGFGKAFGSARNFFKEQLIPAQKHGQATVQTDGLDGSEMKDGPLTWENFNKRGYFVLLTLVVGAIIAIWVTKETSSWKSATEAARKERDAQAEIITRQNTELDKLRPEKASLEAELKSVKQKLDVEAANAATYRDRYHDLTAQKAVSPDMKELQTKLENANTRTAKSREELAGVKGEIQSSKDSAETYKGLYEKMRGERDTANERVRAIQSEKDDLQDQIANLKAKVHRS